LEVRVIPEVVVLDKDGVRRGVISELLAFDARPRWRDVAGWRIEARGAAADMLFQPGSGIVVRVDGVPVFSGLTGQVRIGPLGTVEASGWDDGVLLQRRLALTGEPDYPLPLTQEYSGAPETVVYEIVDDNIGPNADPDRQTVVLGTDAGSGDAGVWEATNQPVYDLVRDILQGQQWGFQVRWEDDGVRRFTVLIPVDRTADIRLSDVNETVADWERVVEPPETNFVYVAGEIDTDSDTRVIEFGGYNCPWGRIETWRDARTSEAAGALEQLRDDILTGECAVDVVTAEVFPTGAFSFPADYNVGDEVSVTVGDVRTTAVVVGLDISESDVRPVLSNGRVVGPLKTVDAIKGLERRMSRQETV
jgi:hypothetical protein